MMNRKHFLTMAAAFGCAIPFASPVLAQDGSGTEPIVLRGVVRDFIERTKEGGHPDFERKPDAGFGLYQGNIAEYLDADGKPVFTGGGRKVKTQWKTSDGKPIYIGLFDESLGDVVGSVGGYDSGGIESAESFAKWFRDEPGVNLSRPLEITLERSGGTDDLPIYTYETNSFFPIDGELFGNSGGTPDHNFHFTYELHTEFTYKEGTGQVFSFYGDDDVFVFINGKKVIDIGGVHPQVWQTVDIERLGLEDGKTYPLDFFFAERHRTQSNFRIDTTLQLKNQDLPTVSAAYD